MTRNQEHPHQRQVYATQYSCRQCRFTTVDIEHIRRHVNGHMLEAALNFHGPTSMAVPIQQLRERNLFFNPFRQLLPTLARPTSETHRHQRHRSLQRSEARMSRSLLQNRRRAVEVVRESTRRVTEETSDAGTMPLINQLNHPIPVIIDLESDQSCDDNQLDLSLRL